MLGTVEKLIVKHSVIAFPNNIILIRPFKCSPVLLVTRIIMYENTIVLFDEAEREISSFKFQKLVLFNNHGTCVTLFSDNSTSSMSFQAFNFDRGDFGLCHKNINYNDLSPS